MQIKPKSKAEIKQKSKPKVQKLICWDDYVGYPVGSNLDEAVTFATNAAEKFNSIKKFKGKEVNIWCRGSSGAILAALFGAHVENFAALKICHLKKEGERSHSGGP